MANAEADAVIEELREQGWKVVETKNMRWECTPPDPKKDKVYFSVNHNQNVWQNVLHLLRKEGYMSGGQRTRRVKGTLAEQVAAVTAAAEEQAQRRVVAAALAPYAPPPTALPVKQGDEDSKLDQLYLVLKTARRQLAYDEAQLAQRDRECIEVQDQQREALKARNKAVDAVRQASAALVSEGESCSATSSVATK